jgi:hypothetical protein
MVMMVMMAMGVMTTVAHYGCYSLHTQAEQLPQ